MKKKLLAVLITFALVLSSVSALAGSFPQMAPFPTTDTDAIYEPYYEDLNELRFTPWFRTYHMQTAADYANGNYGGEGGQIIMTLSVSPVNSDHVLMGSDMSGGWVSRDGGKNWRIMGNNVNTWAVADSKWDPVDENKAYIIQAFKSGSIEGKHTHSTVDGLYKTTDAGRSWTQINEFNYVQTNSAENLIYFDAQNNLYTLSSNGVYKSTDEGATWTRLGKLVYTTETSTDESGTETTKYNYFYTNGNDTTYTEDVTKVIYSMYVSKDGQTIAVAAYKGLYVTYDGGATWGFAGDVFNGVTAYSIAVDTSNDKHWVAITSGSGVYTSTDAGKNWQTMNSLKYTNDTYYPAFVKFTQPKADGTPNLIMIFNTMNCPFRVALNGSKTNFTTTEATKGGDWVRPTFGPNSTNKFLNANGYYSEGLAVSESDPNLVYFSFGDMIFKSTDGGVTFDIACSGFSGNYVNQFFFGPDNRLWFAFTDKGLGATDSAYNSEKLPTAKMIKGGGTASSVAIDPNDSNHIFTNLGDWSDQRLQESTDGGATWTARTDVAKAPFAIMRYVADNTIISSKYTSTDNGVTWTANSKTYHGLSKLDPKVVYSTSSKIYYRSTDGGANWTQYSSPNNSSIECVYPDEFDKNVVWLGTYSGDIFKVTYDSVGAATATRKSTGIPYRSANFQVSVMAIAQDPNNSKHLVAGGKGTSEGTNSYGIVETWDGGDSWYVVPGSVGPMNVQTLQFSPVSEEVFIGTCSNGTIIYEYNNYSNTDNIVKFNNNGVAGSAPSKITGAYGATATIPEVKVSKKGYTFAGWEYTYNVVDSTKNTVSTATKIYQPGDTFTIQYKDVTLKAVWKEASGFFDESGNVLEELPAGKVKGVMYAENYSGTALPVIGVYYKDSPRKMVTFVAGNSVNFSETGYAECEIDLTEYDTSNVFIKMFLIGDFDNVAPVTNFETLE